MITIFVLLSIILVFLLWALAGVHIAMHVSEDHTLNRWLDVLNSSALRAALVAAMWPAALVVEAWRRRK